MNPGFDKKQTIFTTGDSECFSQLNTCVFHVFCWVIGLTITSQNGIHITSVDHIPEHCGMRWMYSLPRKNSPTILESDTVSSNPRGKSWEESEYFITSNLVFPNDLVSSYLKTSFFLFHSYFLFILHGYTKVPFSLARKNSHSKKFTAWRRFPLSTFHILL